MAALRIWGVWDLPTVDTATAVVANIGEGVVSLGEAKNQVKREVDVGARIAHFVSFSVYSTLCLYIVLLVIIK